MFLSRFMFSSGLGFGVHKSIARVPFQLLGYLFELFLNPFSTTSLVSFKLLSKFPSNPFAFLSIPLSHECGKQFSSLGPAPLSYLLPLLAQQSAAAQLAGRAALAPAQPLREAHPASPPCPGPAPPGRQGPAYSPRPTALPLPAARSIPQHPPQRPSSLPLWPKPRRPSPTRAGQLGHAARELSLTPAHTQLSPRPSPSPGERAPRPGSRVAPSAPVAWTPMSAACPLRSTDAQEPLQPSMP